MIAIALKALAAAAPLAASIMNKIPEPDGEARALRRAKRVARLLKKRALLQNRLAGAPPARRVFLNAKILALEFESDYLISRLEHFEAKSREDS